MRRVFILPILILLLVASAALANDKSPPDQTGSEPVTIQVSDHQKARRYALFPLEFPSYILRFATWPIGIGTRYLAQSGAIDRVMNFLSNDDKTFWVYPIIEGGAGSSFGGGVGVKHSDLFHRDYHTGASYRTHINEDQIANGYFAQPNAFEVAGRPISYGLDVEWLRFMGQDFYGIGDGSTQANHSKYMTNQTRIKANIGYNISDPLSISLELGTKISTTGNSTRDGYPSVSTTFPLDTLAGFQDWITYFTAGLKLAYDTRDNKLLSERGGLYLASITNFKDVDHGSFDFIRYNIDLRHSFPLWKPRSALTLHTGWVFNRSTGGSPVPFYELAVLDAFTPLRGFSRGRFEDNDSAIFNVEYRFPLWDTFDGVVFFDTGRVFHTPSDFAFKNFKFTGGGGLRMRFLGLMLLRLDVAYGGEGVNYIFGVSKSL